MSCVKSNEHEYYLEKQKITRDNWFNNVIVVTKNKTEI